MKNKNKEIPKMLVIFGKKKKTNERAKLFAFLSKNEQKCRLFRSKQDKKWGILIDFSRICP